MKLIDKAATSRYRLFVGGYTRTDIIRNMCPFELGLDDSLSGNENCASGYKGCELCWNREYPVDTAYTNENEAGMNL